MKGVKAGLSLKEVETMPYRKLLALIKGSKAVYSEEMVDLLHIVANPSLLEGKKSRTNYPRLFKTFENIVKENGIKTVTIDANFDQLVAMKTLQEEERRKRK